MSMQWCLLSVITSPKGTMKIEYIYDLKSLGEISRVCQVGSSHQGNQKSLWGGHARLLDWYRCTVTRKALNFQISYLWINLSATMCHKKWQKLNQNVKTQGILILRVDFGFVQSFCPVLGGMQNWSVSSRWAARGRQKEERQAEPQYNGWTKRGELGSQLWVYSQH